MQLKKMDVSHAKRAIVNGLLMMALPLTGDLIFSFYVGELRIAYPGLYALAFIIGVFFS